MKMVLVTESSYVGVTGLLQEEVVKEGDGDKDILYLSLAGLKQVGKRSVQQS